MPMSRADGEARREALLDAALVSFDAKGIVQTGIEDIRKAAKASPSSVYHQFAGLTELIAALLERTFVRRYSVVTAAVIKTKTAKAAVQALVTAHLGWVFGNAVEARFMYRALALNLDGGKRADLVALKSALKADLMTHLAKVGVLLPGGPEMVIDVVLLGTTHQACRVWLGSARAVDARWMKNTLPEIAWQTARVAKLDSL